MSNVGTASPPPSGGGPPPPNEDKIPFYEALTQLINEYQVFNKIRTSDIALAFGQATWDLTAEQDGYGKNEFAEAFVEGQQVQARGAIIKAMRKSTFH